MERAISYLFEGAAGAARCGTMPNEDPSWR